MLRTYGVSGLQAHIRHTIALGSEFHSWVLGRPDLFRVLTPLAFALTVLTIEPGSESAEAEAEVAPDSNQAEPQTKGERETNHEAVHILNNELERANEITRLVYEKINAEGQIFLTSTVVQGIYAIRVVSANPKADREHLKKAFDILVTTTEEIRGMPEPRTS